LDLSPSPRRSFSFLCRRDPRHLHSFPTRRSSDLAIVIELFGTSPRKDRPVKRPASTSAAKRATVAGASVPKSATSKRPRSLIVKDRKSTRLNSSHLGISYAVFCLKKKKKNLNSI